ncbi:MAG: glycosyl hydrolase family 28-related protein [Armatimonadetes bacterium]|nr:glycosyl hydrolase family 28-related protein [Armatimonadota bacterium]
MMPRNRAARLWALLLCLPALPIAATADAPPMRWLFREGSGSVVREASGGCGLTMAGGKWVRGVAGPAVELNGRTDHLEALDAAAANTSGAFTIAFWMNPASWSDQYSAGVVSKKRSDATPGYVIYGDGTAPTKITLRIAGTAGGHAMLTSASDVDEDVWQHWAVTYDPAARAVTWYKNGKPDKRYEGILIGDTSNDTPLRVGHAHTWNGHFDGLIDTVEITHRAWSPAEVRREAASRSASIRPAPGVAARWRVVKPRFATADLVVARCTVRDAGAMGDGVTDDTAAFQAAMGATSRAGGGTVFVPSGRYALRGNLRVPTGVTLRGEWERPRPGAPVRGTVLMAYPGRGEADGRPFLAMRQCTGLRDLAIWYPEQNPARIVPYPFCIEQMGSASASVEHVTLVNAYQGIRTNYGSYLHYFHGIYGSPLSIGIEIDFVSDTGRVDEVDFGPELWSASGLPGSPANGGPHAAWMRANGTGMLFRRYEWIYSAFVSLRGYQTGICMVNSDTFGETNGQMYKVRVERCGIGVDVLNANFAGLSFTRCTLSGDEFGIATRPTFNSRLLLHTCTLTGGRRAALLDGIANQSILMQKCALTGGVERVRGDLVMLGCTLGSFGEHLRLGREAATVKVAGTTYREPARIVNECASGRVTLSDEAAASLPAPDIAMPEDRRLQPSRPLLFVVKARPRGPKQGLPGDDTAAIQAALDRARAAGGGAVLLPAGIYSLRGGLTVPTGVELRGVYDVQHHTKGWGSLVRVFAGRGDEKARPAVVLQSGAGLRGLTFYYPEQRFEAVTPYPYLVQGRGAGVYIVNVTGVNPYRFIDLATYRCDRHAVQYAAGAPLRVGIAVGGGSRGGQVRSVQFNSHYWAWSPLPDCPGVAPGKGNPAWQYQYDHLEAFVLGSCSNEFQYQNTVFGSRIGLRCLSENGAGPGGLILGHGTDGSLISMQFDGAAPGGIDVVNSQLVSMDCAGLPFSLDKAYVRCGAGLRSEVRMINTTLWGSPMHSAAVYGGALTVDLASFCQFGTMLVTGGSFRATAAFFGQPLNPQPELDVRPPGRAAVTACLSPFGLHRSMATPAGAVEEALGGGG